MITMKAPSELCDVCVAGARLRLDDGFVEVEEAQVETLRAHGFAPAPKSKSKTEARDLAQGRVARQAAGQIAAQIAGKE